MRFRSYFLAFPTVVCLSSLLGPATDAGAQTTTDERAWFVLTLQERGGPESPWRWYADTIFRSRDGLDELEVFSQRVYLTYNFTPRTNVGGGYVYVRGFPVSGGSLTEHRPFIQYAWVGRVSGSTLTLRTRVEFRIVEDNDRTVTRVRQQVRLSRPLTGGSRLALVGYDELFLHVNSSARNVSGVDQNRVFVGVSDTVNPSTRFEVGYLNQFLPGHGASDRMNHVLSGALVFSF